MKFRRTPTERCVASGILPDVEGGILPPGSRVDRPEHGRAFQRIVTACGFSAGLEARLYGRQDACRYEGNVTLRPESIVRLNSSGRLGFQDAMSNP